MGCGASKVPPTVDEPCVASDTSHHNPSSQHKKTKSERTATSKKYLAPEDEEERDFIAEASKEPQSRTQPDVCTQIPLPPAQKPVIQQSAVASGAGNVQQVANKEKTSPARQQSQPAEVMVIPQPPVGSPPPMDIALKREAAGKPVLAEVAFTDHLGAYGSFRFRGAEAANYLQRHGLQPDALDDYSWTRTSADKVAAAVLEWARSKGATMSTHWFQPLGSAGIRRGQTGQVHNAMFNFGKGGELEWCFEAGDLLKGETDGSSYMNGGMRATHTAGGYTVLDPSSPMWVRGDTLFIPTLFVSYTGKALDEKTPLLRAMQAVSTAGVRLLKALGHTCKSVFPNIGLEQEFFLVPKKAFRTRTDLQLAGRTVMGRAAPRGQELSDHYMSPLNAAALRCMKEMQHECFKMGIPLKTRHREVAPNQYECAPFFGLATVQIDENLLVMELMEEIADKHNLVCLLAEKPFKGINGSGKHNNFSLGTEDGLNLFNGPQMTKVTGNDQAFPVVMAAVIKAVHAHGDLMRMSIASPGNDFRLGAMEAPPAIMSTYLGKSLTSYLEAFKRGEAVGAYVEKKSFVHMGLDSIAPFAVPAEDRNRTSPFPYGGHRFEFRAVGSSQNVSMVNTVLCTIIAEQFELFAAAMEGGRSARDVASAALDEAWPVIFNGNGYSNEWPIEAEKRGLWRIDSGVDAVERLTDASNVELFAKSKVMDADETRARAEAMHLQYAGIVEIEARCMVDMIQTMVLPAIGASPAVVPAELVETLRGAKARIDAALHEMEAALTAHKRAEAARVLRLTLMEQVRAACDEAEAIVPKELWPMSTYKELLFLDFEQGTRAES